MAIHVGASGWSYDHWQGVLYPEGLPPRDRLGCYTSRFTTVELNASFYRWPRRSAFDSWRRRLPEGFVFTVKAPRLLTHFQRLYQPERWTERITSDMARLGARRGPLLVQLSPNFPFDYERLAYFLKHATPWVRVAVEFRHPSWHQEATFGLLETYGAAYCVMSGAHLPCILRATANFAYVRLHGPDTGHLYGGSYSDDDMRWWADRVREWAHQGRDVFAYFNNDGGGNAVRNAWTLRHYLGV